MYTYQLPDGTWATTAVYVGPRSSVPLCAEEAHDWVDQVKNPIPSDGERPEGMAFMTLQQCKVCRATRVHLTKD